jgi:hypothetical protein
MDAAKFCRVEASYPATDGSCPESITVEIPADLIGPELLTDVTSALARVPHQRDVVAASIRAVDRQATRRVVAADEVFELASREAGDNQAGEGRG